jgi:hypothetical protein
MRDWRNLCRISCLCAFALATPTARAQQTNPQGTQDQQQNQAATPIPAYHSPLASGNDEENTEENPQGVEPDTTPLAGAQYISLGNVETTRSYWQPRFDLSGTGDSNPTEETQNATWGTWTSFVGGVDIHRVSGRSDLAMDYTGGELYSNDSAAANGVVQELGITEKITMRRSVIEFIDQLGYLPQASLGLGGAEGLPASGLSSTGLGPGFTVGQSILTGQGQNISNSSVVELDTFLTPRSSLTFAGGASLLRYFGSDLLDSSQATFQGGYNYQLTQKDTIAAIYAFSALRYSNFDQSIDTHSVQLSYGRRVTGRLSFQISAGPQVGLYQTPISGVTSGGTGGTGAPVGSTTQFTWSLNTALRYQRERTTFGLAYTHGISGGSGALGGSNADTASASIDRRMSRTFSSGLSAGYSRNIGLSIGTSQPASQTYDYWYGGATFAHPLSATLALTFSYQIQYQNSNSSFCIGPTCGTHVVRNLITVGFGWHERPLLF